MKKLGIIFALFLSGCVYHNPLDSADFRFQTLNTPPYMLCSWYRVGERGKPLTVYVEKPVLDDETRSLAAKDKSINVAYIARPCQYFQTDICEKPVSAVVSNKAVNQAIQQLQKKAGTNEVKIKGM